MTAPGAGQLRQLEQRLDGQGFEVRIIRDKLFAIAPPASSDADRSRLVDCIAATSRPDARGCMWHYGEARRTEVITCAPREDDGGRLWFFDVHGRPVEEASHVIDAALLIGGRLAGARTAV